MDDTRNTSTEGTQTGTEGTQTGRTFTQDEVNRIVQDRLAKEKGKGSEELDKRAAELDKRERRLNAIDKLRESGLPDYLVDALNMNTDEDFQKSLEVILKMKGEAPKDAGGTNKSDSGQVEPGTIIIGRGNPIGVVDGGNYGDPLRQAFGLG